MERPHAQNDASCLGLDALEALASGRLDDASARAHVATCAACTTKLESIRAEQALFVVETPFPDTTEPDATVAASLPERIGDYRPTRLIALGGQGVVYEATDAKGRRVALKAIRNPSVSLQARRRFRAEAEMLGRLDHPGVARVLDAGVADTPRGPLPFIAIEYIEGISLTEYDTQALTLDQRVALLVEIGDIVAHAHQQGIVHRDLTPNNIMMLPDGSPKIIDFGLARIGSAALRSQTITTVVGTLLGTPQYMSPEQASGEVDQVDERTDVYALGVIAYEMLSNQPPYDVSGRPLMEQITMICSKPVRPITAVNPQVSATLEQIIMHALERSLDGRCRSVAEFVAHLRRYLTSERTTPPPRRIPAADCPEDSLDEASAQAALTALVHLVGTGSPEAYGEVAVAALHAHLHHHASSMAPEHGEDVPDVAIDHALMARIGEVLDRANRVDIGIEILDRVLLRQIEQAFVARRRHPSVGDASFHETMGALYSSLGRYPAAERQWRRAVASLYSALGQAHERTLAAMYELGRIYVQQGRFVAGETILTELNDLVRSHLAPSHRLTLNTTVELAMLYQKMDQLELAEDLMLRAVRKIEAAFGAEATATLETKSKLATIYVTTGKFDDAYRILEMVHAHYARTRGPDDLKTLRAWGNIGNVHWERGRYDDARAIFESTYEIMTQRHGLDHPETGLFMQNLAALYRQTGELDRAEQLFLEALSVRERRLGADHPQTLVTRNNLAILYALRGDHPQAIDVFEAVMSARERLLGREHLHTLYTATSLASAYRDAGDHARARAVFEGIEPDLKRAVNRLQSGSGAPSRTGLFLTRYGECLAELERTDQARQVLDEAHRLLEGAFGVDHFRTREAYEARARLDAS